jgi:hypothetical protein
LRSILFSIIHIHPQAEELFLFYNIPHRKTNPSSKFYKNAFFKLKAPFHYVIIKETCPTKADLYQKQSGVHIAPTPPMDGQRLKGGKE